MTQNTNIIRTVCAPGRTSVSKAVMRAIAPIVAVSLLAASAFEPLDVDFHTVPEGKPISASETFMRGTASAGQGLYRAPYPGLHGWYWKNSGKENVKILLNASGFFTEARMFSGDPVGEQMEVKDPPPPEF